MWTAKVWLSSISVWTPILSWRTRECKHTLFEVSRKQSILCYGFFDDEESAICFDIWFGCRCGIQQGWFVSYDTWWSKIIHLTWKCSSLKQGWKASVQTGQVDHTQPQKQWPKPTGNDPYDLSFTVVTAVVWRSMPFQIVIGFRFCETL